MIDGSSFQTCRTRMVRPLAAARRLSEWSIRLLNKAVASHILSQPLLHELAASRPSPNRTRNTQRRGFAVEWRRRNSIRVFDISRVPIAFPAPPLVSRGARFPYIVGTLSDTYSVWRRQTWLLWAQVRDVNICDTFFQLRHCTASIASKSRLCRHRKLRSS
jgi:hypothetical protein